jgi:hypothetical protein
MAARGISCEKGLPHFSRRFYHGSFPSAVYADGDAQKTGNDAGILAELSCCPGASEVTVSHPIAMVAGRDRTSKQRISDGQEEEQYPQAGDQEVGRPVRERWRARVGARRRSLLPRRITAAALKLGYVGVWPISAEPQSLLCGRLRTRRRGPIGAALADLRLESRRNTAAGRPGPRLASPSSRRTRRWVDGIWSASTPRVAACPTLRVSDHVDPRVQVYTGHADFGEAELIGAIVVAAIGNLMRRR